MIIDRAGAIIERYVFDDYGRIRNRESAGRGDMNNDSSIDVTYDTPRISTAVSSHTIWDARADMDGSGTFTDEDANLYDKFIEDWYPAADPYPTVSQAFSDVDNPYGFQGRVHFAIDTSGGATDGKLMLVDHRARMNDPVTGRWLQRDPLGSAVGVNLYQCLGSNPLSHSDPNGLFLTQYHKSISKNAFDLLTTVNILPEARRAIISANWQTDVWEFFVPKAHAQEPKFVNRMRGLMRTIKSESCMGGSDSVVAAIGQALHTLQDFYSHTDWLDGRSLAPQYAFWGDYGLLVRGLRHPSRSVSETLNLDLLASGSNTEVSDIIYFDGGTNPDAIDNHNKYSADGPELGREITYLYFGNVPPGPFANAKIAATNQTVEFLEWAISHMKEDCKKQLQCPESGR